MVFTWSRSTTMTQVCWPIQHLLVIAQGAGSGVRVIAADGAEQFSARPPDRGAEVGADGDGGERSGGGVVGDVFDPRGDLRGVAGGP